jgi:hypothetical protein
MIAVGSNHARPNAGWTSSVGLAMARRLLSSGRSRRFLSVNQVGRSQLVAFLACKPGDYLRSYHAK